MNDVLRGVLFSLGGNIAISVGDHLKVFGSTTSDNKKLIYKSNKKKRYNSSQTSYHSYRTIFSLLFCCSSSLFFNLFGYILMIIGQICNGYALAFAPQTLLACIGSVQFIMNLLCSAVLMSRPIKLIHIIGTLSIISGCLIMIFGFSPHNNSNDLNNLTVYTLIYNYNSTHYRNYLIVVVTVFLLSLIWNIITQKYLKFNQNNQYHNSKLNISNSKKSISFAHRIFCIDPMLISGFFYSFSSAMTGTQSVVLGKSLAIIIRKYLMGKIFIFNPLDLYTLFFIIISFISFIITFAFWIYRRTESMLIFDTVFIAPMNQVMWLTFSTVAGGIYFHEFENAHTFQWIGLIFGMMLNYVGLYYLVPTASDQPILIINMEKPKKNKTKIDCKPQTQTQTQTQLPIHNRKLKQNINDSITEKLIKHKSYINIACNDDDDIIDNDNEHETDYDYDYDYDDNNNISLPLHINLNKINKKSETNSDTSSDTDNNNNNNKYISSITPTSTGTSLTTNRSKRISINLNDHEHQTNSEQVPLLLTNNLSSSNISKLHDSYHASNISKWYNRFFAPKKH